MIIKKNKEKTKEKLLRGNVSEIEVITPNIADKALSTIDDYYKLDEIINNTMNINRHIDAIPILAFIYALISSKMKRLFSISESVFALTLIPILNKFNINILSRKKLMTE